MWESLSGIVRLGHRKDQSQLLGADFAESFLFLLQFCQYVRGSVQELLELLGALLRRKMLKHNPDVRQRILPRFQVRLGEAQHCPQFLPAHAVFLAATLWDGTGGASD